MASEATGRLWGELEDVPIFVLTGDQDWAPEWALASMLELVTATDVPLHLFMTNSSSLLEGRADSAVTTGIHPNFLSGSSHGATPEAVVESCLQLCPTAVTSRSHSFAEDSRILALLVRRGITADSNLCLYLQPHITPLLHASGLLRLPVFLEDDVLLSIAGPAEPEALEPHLFTPGLKILSFHPVHVALNTPSLDYYDRHRQALYDDRRGLVRYGGRGVRDVLADLIDLVKGNGYEFQPFPVLVDDVRRMVQEHFPSGLVGWETAAARSSVGGQPEDPERRRDR